MGKQVFMCERFVKVLTVVALIVFACLPVFGVVGSLAIASASVALVSGVLLALCSAGIAASMYARYIRIWNDRVEVGEDRISYVSSKGDRLELKWDEIGEVRRPAGGLYLYGRGGDKVMKISEILGARQIHALVAKRLERVTAG